MSDLPSIPPRKQKVAFLGPVGNANGLVPDIREGLQQILGPAVDTIELIVEPSLQTPTIQLWHDEHQDIQWKPLNDCWGPKGADSLWRNRPSADDILQLDCLSQNYGGQDGQIGSATNTESGMDKEQMISNLHLIMEMGASAAGGGQDSEFLFDSNLMSQVSHLCIEPVAFPEATNDENGTLAIPHQDVASSQERLRPHASNINMIVPDSHLVDAWIKSGYLQETCRTKEVIGRFGPLGSRIYRYTSGGAELSCSDKSDGMDQQQQQQQQQQVDYISVPTATLETSNGNPINPTGAGNSYSAALSTCRSRGWSLEESACLATAVGATFCEYEHLPPWNWEVLDRIQRGTLEVYNAITTSTSTT